MSKLSEYSKFDHLLDTSSSEEEEDVARGGGERMMKKKKPAGSTPEADDNDDNDDHDAVVTTTKTTNTNTNTTVAKTASCTSTTTTTTMMPRMRPAHATHSLRFVFEYPIGNPIYEWEQSLNDVVLYIPAPPSSQKVQVTIKPNHIQVGLLASSAASSQSQQYYIDEDTYDIIDTTESTWCYEETEIEDHDDDHDDDKQRTTTTKKKKRRMMIVIYLQKMSKGIVWKSALKGNPALLMNTVCCELDPISYEHVKQDLLKQRFQEENPGMDFRDATFNNSSSEIPDPRTFMGGIRYD